MLHVIRLQVCNYFTFLNLVEKVAVDHKEFGRVKLCHLICWDLWTLHFNDTVRNTFGCRTEPPHPTLMMMPFPKTKLN